MPKKVAFHTLGCKVNQYETEAMAERFRSAGYQVVDENQRADAYVVNTCTVTSLADRKSRQFIRRAKNNNPDAVIAVTGCYAQIKPEEVAAIDGVEIVCGSDQKGNILQLVEQRMALRENPGGEALSKYVGVLSHDELVTYEELGHIRGMGSRTRAYIKIQDGCENYCSYCIIPYARGHIRSRNVSDITQEVKNLVEAGYREIVLTGINTAYYGKESGAAGGIEPLIASLNNLPGDFRIRLSSLEPTLIDASYVKKLLKYDRLCHHLHLALQSGSDPVLSAMNRKYTMQEYMEIVDVLRNFDPNYGISTDIIVGFPGETEENFLDSVRTVQEVNFCKTHVFKYSPREGTPAASMAQIHGEIKNERSRILIQEAELAAERFYRQNAGSQRIVLLERDAQDPITGENQGMENPDYGAARDLTKFAVGYTDNYIKTYVPHTEEKGEELFGNFSRVRLDDLEKDGMKGLIL